MSRKQRVVLRLRRGGRAAVEVVPLASMHANVRKAARGAHTCNWDDSRPDRPAPPARAPAGGPVVITHRRLGRPTTRLVRPQPGWSGDTKMQNGWPAGSANT